MWPGCHVLTRRDRSLPVGLTVARPSRILTGFLATSVDRLYTRFSPPDQHVAPHCQTRAEQWKSAQLVLHPEPLHRPDASVVRRRLPRADTRPAGRVESHRRRREHPGHRAHRLGQDPVGVSLGTRFTCRPPRSVQGHARPLHLPTQSTGGRRRAQPARATGGHHTRLAGTRDHRTVDHRRRALGRHPRRPASTPRQNATRHPHHHARVALPDAHLVGTGSAHHGRDGDRRRGTRRRRHQTRHAPGAVARTPRRTARLSGATHRTLGDGPPARASR